MLRRTSSHASLRTALAIAAVALIAAACGSTAATGAPSASPSPELSASPSAGPTASPSVTWTPNPSAAAVAYDILMGQAKLAAPANDSGKAAAAEINDFGFDLFRRLDSKGNLVASPASIALALGMVRAGAKGTTATQMDTVLHSFGAAGQSAEIVALIDQLEAQTMYVDKDGNLLPPGATPDPANPSPAILLTVADQVFSQKGMALVPGYLDSLSSTYGAGAAQLDFAADPESARLTINKWASDQTKGRIPNVLQPGDIQPATRIALANAIYLKSSWMTKFDKAQTKPAPFTTASGTVVTVPTMNIDMEYRYGAGTGYRMIGLPLEAGSSMQMLIIVPDDMASFTSGLTNAKLTTMYNAMGGYEVTLAMPKFSVETRVDAAGLLAAMGMPDLFSATAADLSGITTEEKLYIDKVIHQANIDVDEDGVTASAVTVAAGLGGAGEPPPKVTFKIDKPFLYMVREWNSGVVLFMGRVDDPSPAS
jgi:serpin B